MKPSTLVAAAVIAAMAGGVVACDKSDVADLSAVDSGREGSAAEDAIDPKEVVAALEDPGTSDARRLEAIHQARDATVTEAAPALRGLLGADNPEIVVAAAAALDGLGATDAASDVIEAASRLSRDHNFEYLRQLLFIIGEIGGPQARIYLETVADGHQVPAIRQTAAHVLEETGP